MRPALTAAVLLAAAAMWPSIAKAADRRVEVVNASRQDLREFYASNTKRGSWEEDILGEDVLPPGAPSPSISTMAPAPAASISWRCWMAAARLSSATSMSARSAASPSADGMAHGPAAALRARRCAMPPASVSAMQR
ncbi:hypothetical protein ACFQU7_03700 [Pseudoroseomonas wenyumeiae]